MVWTNTQSALLDHGHGSLTSRLNVVPHASNHLSDQTLNSELVTYAVGGRPMIRDRGNWGKVTLSMSAFVLS